MTLKLTISLSIYKAEDTALYNLYTASNILRRTFILKAEKLNWHVMTWLLHPGVKLGVDLNRQGSLLMRCGDLWWQFCSQSFFIWHTPEETEKNKYISDMWIWLFNKRSFGPGFLTWGESYSRNKPPNFNIFFAMWYIKCFKYQRITFLEFVILETLVFMV